MSTRFSKILLVCEALLLIMPISLLFITTLPGAFAALAGPAAGRAASVLIFAMGGALLAAVLITAAFCIDGVAGLRRVRAAWWGLSAAGALISIAGVVTVILKKFITLPNNDFIFVLRLASMGILLMIPLAHVLLERLFRTKSAHAA
jgi:hypothetical protein